VLRRLRRSTSRPSIRGMSTSSTIKSGRCERAFSRASTPFATVSTWKWDDRSHRRLLRGNGRFDICVTKLFKSNMTHPNLNNLGCFVTNCPPLQSPSLPPLAAGGGRITDKQVVRRHRRRTTCLSVLSAGVILDHDEVRKMKFGTCHAWSRNWLGPREPGLQIVAEASSRQPGRQECPE